MEIVNKIITNDARKRGSFKGEPEGFVNLPVGSLFGRHEYRYWKKLPNESWTPYVNLYYQPTRLELERDSFGKMWYMRPDGWKYVGEFNITGQKQESVGPDPIEPSSSLMELYYWPSEDAVSPIKYECGDSISSLLDVYYSEGYSKGNVLRIRNTGDSDLVISGMSIDGFDSEYINVSIYNPLDEDFHYLNDFPFPITIPAGSPEDNELVYEVVFDEGKIIEDLGEGNRHWTLNVESNNPISPTCSFDVGGDFQPYVTPIWSNTWYEPFLSKTIYSANLILEESEGIGYYFTAERTENNNIKITNNSVLTTENNSVRVYIGDTGDPIDERDGISWTSTNGNGAEYNYECDPDDTYVGVTIQKTTGDEEYFGTYYIQVPYSEWISNEIEFDCGSNLEPSASYPNYYESFELTNISTDTDSIVNYIKTDDSQSDYVSVFVWDDDTESMIPASLYFENPVDVFYENSIYYEVVFDREAILNDFGSGSYTANVSYETTQGTCEFTVEKYIHPILPEFLYEQNGNEWNIPSSGGGQYYANGGSSRHGWGLWISTSDTTRELVHFEENTSGGETFNLSEYYDNPAVQDVPGNIKKFFLTYTLIGSGGGNPLAEIPSNINIVNYAGDEPIVTNYTEMESKFEEIGCDWIYVDSNMGGNILTCNFGQWIEVDVTSTNVTISTVNSLPELPITPGYEDYTIPEYTGESVVGDMYGFDRSENSYYTSSLSWEPYGMIVQSDMSDNGKYIHSKFWDTVNSEYKTLFFEFDEEIQTFVEHVKSLPENLNGWNADSTGKRKVSRNGDLLTGAITGSQAAYGFWRSGEEYPEKVWYIDQTHQAKFLTSDGKFVFGTYFHPDEHRTVVFVYNTETQEEMYVMDATDVYMVPYSSNFFIGRERINGNITKFIFVTEYYTWLMENRPFAINGTNIDEFNFNINDLSLDGNVMIGRTYSSPSAPIYWNLLEEPVDFKRESHELPMSNPSGDHTLQTISSDGSIVIGTVESDWFYWKLYYTDGIVTSTEGPFDLQQSIFDRTSGLPQEFWNPSNPPPLDNYVVNSTFQPVIGYQGRQFMFSTVKVLEDGSSIRPSIGYAIPTEPLLIDPDIPPPINNNFEDAIDIDYQICGETLILTGSNINATRQDGEPYPITDSDDEYVSASIHSVWWKWTPSMEISGSNVTFDLVSSSYDTQIAVYTGSSLSTLEKIIFDDDFYLDYRSKVAFDFTPGVTYYIQVDGYYGEMGDIDLRVKVPCPEAPCEYTEPSDLAPYGDGLLQGFASTDFSDTYWNSINSASTGPSFYSETIMISDDGKYTLIGGPRYTSNRQFAIIEKTGSSFLSKQIDQTGINQLTGVRRQYDYVSTSDPLNHQIARNGIFVSGVNIGGSPSIYPNASACWKDGFDNPPLINANPNYYRWISDNGRYTLGYNVSNQPIVVDLINNTEEIITGSTYQPQAFNYCMDKIVGWSSIDPNERAAIFTKSSFDNWVEEEGIIVAHNVDPEVDYPSISCMSGDGTKLCGYDSYGYNVALYWDLSQPPTGGYYQATVLPNHENSSSYGKSGTAEMISSDGTIISGYTEYGYPCFWKSQNNFSKCYLLQDFLIASTYGPNTASLNNGSAWVNGSYNVFGKFGTSVDGKHLIAIAEKSNTTSESMIYASPFVSISDYQFPLMGSGSWGSLEISASRSGDTVTITTSHNVGAYAWTVLIGKTTGIFDYFSSNFYGSFGSNGVDVRDYNLPTSTGPWYINVYSYVPVSSGQTGMYEENGYDYIVTPKHQI